MTGVIFSGMAAAKASQHDEAVEDRKEYEIVKQLADDNQRLKTVQVVTLVTGGVAAAAGGALLLWHHLGDRRRAAGGERALVPLIAGDAAGASLVGRF